MSGTTVTYIAAGSCVIDANQAGNAHYAAAPQAQRTITVNAISQSISFTAPASGTARPGRPVGDRRRLGQPGRADLRQRPGVPRVRDHGDLHRGGQLRHRRQPGRQRELRGRAPGPAHDHGQKIPQSISFTAPATGRRAVRAALSAVGGGSGNPVVFSVDPQRPGVPRVRATVTYAAAGTCVIDANQAGTASYAAAPQVQRTITVIMTPPPCPGGEVG